MSRFGPSLSPLPVGACLSAADGFSPGVFAGAGTPEGRADGMAVGREEVEGEGDGDGVSSFDDAAGVGPDEDGAGVAVAEVAVPRVAGGVSLSRPGPLP